MRPTTSSISQSLQRLAKAVHSEQYGCIKCPKRKLCRDELACDAYRTYFDTGLWPRWDCEETRFPTRDAYEHVFLRDDSDAIDLPLSSGATATSPGSSQNIVTQPHKQARRAERKKTRRRKDDVRHMRETFSNMISMVLDAEG